MTLPARALTAGIYRLKRKSLAVRIASPRPGGSATCLFARPPRPHPDPLPRPRERELFCAAVPRGGRALRIALDPWLISCAPTGHSVGGEADSFTFYFGKALLK